MPNIYHLIGEGDWEKAQTNGQVRPESLAAEGFIHCSRDEEQLLRVARRLYSERDDLLALEVTPEELTHPLAWEPSRSGEIYPHIYGPLNTEAVVKAWRLLRDAAGNFSLAAG